MNYLSQFWRIDRRHALRAMGTCIALPMLDCMIPLRAMEKATATPRRSAFIYLANGMHSLNYQILTPGRDYQFSRSLKPLEKHREVITPISGMHHPGALVTQQVGKEFIGAFYSINFIDLGTTDSAVVDINQYLTK